MAVFLSRLFAGLTAGSLYTLIALALVVVYRSSKTINFAQGEYALFTCFFAWWLTSKGVPIALTVLPAMIVGFALGMVSERTLIRPIGRRSESAAIIVLLGLFTGLNGLDGWIWGPQNKIFPSLLPNGLNDYVAIAGARLQYTTIGAVVSAAVIVLLIAVLLGKTSLGLKMRAVATSQESAALSGINIGHVLSASWGISAAIGSFAGILIVPTLPPNELSLSGFFSVLVYASTAGILGGLDSIGGTVVGGLIIGVGESLSSGYIGFLHGSLQLTVAFVIMVVVLLVKPTGLFGRRRVVRV